MLSNQNRSIIFSTATNADEVVFGKDSSCGFSFSSGIYVDKPCPYFQSQGYAALGEIVELEDDWNGNGASAFTRDLISKCYHILNFLSYVDIKAFVTPTACGSIQFSFSRDNLYFEFEVFMDRIEVYCEEGDLSREYTLDGENQIWMIIKLVGDFFRCQSYATMTSSGD